MLLCSYMNTPPCSNTTTSCQLIVGFLVAGHIYAIILCEQCVQAGETQRYFFWLDARNNKLFHDLLLNRSWEQCKDVALKNFSVPKMYI